MLRQTLVVNGHRINVESRGPASGQPVVLMHHGLGAIRSWRKQIPVLVSAGYRVVAYDRWGYGRSDGRPALDLPEFNDDQADLLVLLDALALDRPILVGHSDGGSLALYFAAAHPERVKALAAVAAHIYLESKMLPSVEGVRQAFENDRDFRRRFRRVHGDKYASVFENWYSGWSNFQNLGWDMRPVLAKILCPSLVVQGLEDEHATPQHARHLAEAIPAAQLWLVPEAAHMLPQDWPEIFNPRLLDFLQSCAGA